MGRKPKDPDSRYMRKKALFDQVSKACNSAFHRPVSYSKARLKRSELQGNSQKSQFPTAENPKSIVAGTADFQYEAMDFEELQAEQSNVTGDGIDPDLDFIPGTPSSTGDELEEYLSEVEDIPTGEPDLPVDNIEEDQEERYDSDNTTDCELELSVWNRSKPVSAIVMEVTDIYRKFKLSQACVMRIFELGRDIKTGKLPLEESQIPRNFTSFKNALAVDRQFQISTYYKCPDCEDGAWTSFLMEKNVSRKCKMDHQMPRSAPQFQYVKIRDLMAHILPVIHHRLKLDASPSKALDNLRKKVAITNNDVVLQICTDGFPVFKNSKASTWPFLSSFVGCSRRLKKGKGTLLHGIYRAKHFDQDELCKMMSVILKDILRTVEDPIEWVDSNGDTRSTRVYVLNFVGDSPGRADVMNMCHHNSAFGCTYCYQQESGHYFSLQHGVEKRTHESYEQDSALGTSLQPFRGHKGPSPLQELPYFDVIAGCPPDPMHCVFLGVAKLLSESMFSGKFHPFDFHIRKNVQRQIDNDLKKLRLPSRISRVPQNVEKYLGWKYSEHYLWTLYLGPILLEDRLEKDAYENFVLFGHGISQLVSTDQMYDKLQIAKVTLQLFIEEFHRIYTHNDLGNSLRRYNIHLLSHLAEFVELYGQLFKFDMVTFENKLGQIKKNVTGSQFCITQVIQKYLLELLCENEPDDQMSVPKIIKKPFELHGLIPEASDRSTERKFKKLISAGGNVYKQAKSSSVANDTCFFVGPEVIEIDHFLEQLVNGKNRYYIVGRLYKLQAFRVDLRLFHIRRVTQSIDNFKIEIKNSLELLPAIKVERETLNRETFFCKFLNDLDLNRE